MDELMPGIIVNHAQSLQEKLASVVSAWTPIEGLQDSAISGVQLVRSDSPGNCGSSVYEPSLCFVIQGSKTIQLGDREITYEPLSYMASSVHLPVLAQVVGASPERPYLAAKLTVDPQEVASLILEMGDKATYPGPEAGCTEVECGLCVSSMDERMQAAVYRLLRLLDSPDDIAILAPLARREIIYWALIGEMGPRMRRFAATDSQAHRIASVIATLKERYARPLRIRELADAANMSESTLYHSFKQATRMSPLQFQKNFASTKPGASCSPKA